MEFINPESTNAKVKIRIDKTKPISNLEFLRDNWSLTESSEELSFPVYQSISVTFATYKVAKTYFIQVETAKRGFKKEFFSDLVSIVKQQLDLKNLIKLPHTVTISELRGLGATVKVIDVLVPINYVNEKLLPVMSLANIEVYPAFDPIEYRSNYQPMMVFGSDHDNGNPFAKAAVSEQLLRARPRIQINGFSSVRAKMLSWPDGSGVDASYIYSNPLLKGPMAEVGKAVKITYSDVKGRLNGPFLITKDPNATTDSLIRAQLDYVEDDSKTSSQFKEWWDNFFDDVIYNQFYESYYNYSAWRKLYREFVVRVLLGALISNCTIVRSDTTLKSLLINIETMTNYSSDNRVTIPNYDYSSFKDISAYVSQHIQDMFRWSQEAATALLNPDNAGKLENILATAYRDLISKGFIPLVSTTPDRIQPIPAWDSFITNAVVIQPTFKLEVENYIRPMSSTEEFAVLSLVDSALIATDAEQTIARTLGDALFTIPAISSLYEYNFVSIADDVWETNARGILNNFNLGYSHITSIQELMQTVADYKNAQLMNHIIDKVLKHIPSINKESIEEAVTPLTNESMTSALTTITDALSTGNYPTLDKLFKMPEFQPSQEWKDSIAWAWTYFKTEPYRQYIALFDASNNTTLERLNSKYTVTSPTRVYYAKAIVYTILVNVLNTLPNVHISGAPVIQSPLTEGYQLYDYSQILRTINDEVIAEVVTYDNVDGNSASLLNWTDLPEFNDELIDHYIYINKIDRASITCDQYIPILNRSKLGSTYTMLEQKLTDCLISLSKYPSDSYIGNYYDNSWLIGRYFGLNQFFASESIPTGYAKDRVSVNAYWRLFLALVARYGYKNLSLISDQYIYTYANVIDIKNTNDLVNYHPNRIRDELLALPSVYSNLDGTLSSIDSTISDVITDSSDTVGWSFTKEELVLINMFLDQFINPQIDEISILQNYYQALTNIISQPTITDNVIKYLTRASLTQRIIQTTLDQTTLTTTLHVREVSDLISQLSVALNSLSEFNFNAGLLTSLGNTLRSFLDNMYDFSADVDQFKTSLKESFTLIYSIYGITLADDSLMSVDGYEQVSAWIDEHRNQIITTTYFIYNDYFEKVLNTLDTFKATVERIRHFDAFVVTDPISALNSITSALKSYSSRVKDNVSSLLDSFDPDLVLDEVQEKLINKSIVIVGNSNIIDTHKIEAFSRLSRDKYGAVKSLTVVDLLSTVVIKPLLNVTLSGVKLLGSVIRGLFNFVSSFYARTARLYVTSPGAAFNLIKIDGSSYEQSLDDMIPISPIGKVSNIVTSVLSNKGNVNITDKTANALFKSGDSRYFKVFVNAKGIRTYGGYFVPQFIKWLRTYLDKVPNPTNTDPILSYINKYQSVNQWYDREFGNISAGLFFATSAMSILADSLRGVWIAETVATIAKYALFTELIMVTNIVRHEILNEQEQYVNDFIATIKKLDLSEVWTDLNVIEDDVHFVRPRSNLSIALDDIMVNVFNAASLVPIQSIRLVANFLKRVAVFSFKAYKLRLNAKRRKNLIQLIKNSEQNDNSNEDNQNVPDDNLRDEIGDDPNSYPFW